MKSIFLRRLLLALIITLLIASATMVGGYAFISRDTYTEIKLKEMAPKADAAEQLIIEFLDGQITEEAFIRLSKTQMLAVNGATLFVDQENRCMQYQDSIFGMSPEDMQQALSEEITTVLSGGKTPQCARCWYADLHAGRLACRRDLCDQIRAGDHRRNREVEHLSFLDCGNRASGHAADHVLAHKAHYGTAAYDVRSGDRHVEGQF